MNPRLFTTLDCRFDDLRRKVTGMLHKYPLSREDREDIEQEVLLQAYTYLNDRADHSETGLDAFLDPRLVATIVKRRWVDSVRRSQDPARSALTNQFDRPDDETTAGLAETATESVHSRAADDPADEFLRKERTRYLRSQLTQVERTLLALVANGWADSEIAEAQCLSVKTAKWRIQDMKKKCRRILATYDERTR